MFTRATQCVRGVLDPPVSAFSLSLYRHPFLYTLFSSRFTLIINNKGFILAFASSIHNKQNLRKAVVCVTISHSPITLANLSSINNPVSIFRCPSPPHNPLYVRCVDPSCVSRSHTHSSHSQTSRLLTSSLSLGVPVPRVTQCM
jgi:hypothetical protein